MGQQATQTLHDFVLCICGRLEIPNPKNVDAILRQEESTKFILILTNKYLVAFKFHLSEYGIPTLIIEFIGFTPIGYALEPSGLKIYAPEALK